MFKCFETSLSLFFRRGGGRIPSRLAFPSPREKSATPERTFSFANLKRRLMRNREIRKSHESEQTETRAGADVYPADGSFSRLRGNGRNSWRWRRRRNRRRREEGGKVTRRLREEGREQRSMSEESVLNTTSSTSCSSPIRLLLLLFHWCRT